MAPRGGLNDHPLEPRRRRGCPRGRSRDPGAGWARDAQGNPEAETDASDHHPVCGEAGAAGPEPWDDAQVALPVRGLVTTRFSGAHPGIDISAPAGTSVRAIAAGTVVFAGWKNNGGGYVVVVRHPDGMRSTYNHNESVTVTAGARVGAGQRIARLGSTGRSTGPHLDLRIEMGGRLVNPLGLF